VWIDRNGLLCILRVVMELGINVNTRFSLGFEVGINMRFGNIVRAGYILEEIFMSLEIVKLLL